MFYFFKFIGKSWNMTDQYGLDILGYKRITIVKTTSYENESLS